MLSLPKVPLFELALPQRHFKSVIIKYLETEGAHVVFDDLILCARDEVECDGFLEQVLDHACANNVGFNSNKFQFQVSEVKYVGKWCHQKG